MQQRDQAWWYKRACELVRELEGGWYDGSGSHDPNPTMQGITQNTYKAYLRRKGLPEQSVRGITPAEWDEIIRSYWDAAGCEGLPGPVAALVFDHSVNAGPKNAVKVLQRAAGTADDGIFGPATRTAVRSWDDYMLFYKVLYWRMKYYFDLIRPAGSKHRPSIISWLHRLIRFERALNEEKW